MNASRWLIAVAALAGAGSLAWSVRATAAAPKLYAFSGVLTPGQVVNDSQTSSGFGVVFATYDDRASTFHVTWSMSGIIGVNGVSLNTGAPGSNGGVAVDLPLSSVSSATLGPGDEQQLTAAQVRDLKKGLFYFELRNNGFPNGELRGQLLPAGVTFKPVLAQ